MYVGKHRAGVLVCMHLCTLCMLVTSTSVCEVYQHPSCTKMHTHMHVCTHAHTCTHTHAHNHTHTNACIHSGIHTCIHRCLHTQSSRRGLPEASQVEDAQNALVRSALQLLQGGVHQPHAQLLRGLTQRGTWIPYVSHFGSLRKQHFFLFLFLRWLTLSPATIEMHRRLRHSRLA
jgi:hypothetical protein